MAALALGGSAAAAAWLLQQPTAPEGGPVCRSAASLDSDQVVLGPGADPITGCAAMWEAGTLPDPDAPLTPGQAVPPLTACIGPGGAVDVFPAEAEICADLGLALADPEPSPRVNDVTELSTRVVDEINAVASCYSAEEVAEKAEDLLLEVGLTDWSVRSEPDPGGSSCAKATVDSGTDSVVVFFVPAAP